MVSEHAVGIDVSKRKLDVCMARGDKFKSKVLNNTPTGHQRLLDWLLERELDPADTPICLEATGPYSEAVAIVLADAGWRVSVVNPARVKGFAQSQLSRTKTDKSDARLLAVFARSVELERWDPPSHAHRALRQLVDRLQSLIDMRQQECNRLEALEQSEPGSVEDMVREHIDWLDQQIARVESDIDDHIDQNPDLKQDARLIGSIPGIGGKTVACIMAYVGDIRRFQSAKSFAAYLGVTPRQRESGSSVRGRTMMSRTGHAAARKSLYMPGVVATRYNPAIVAMARRLRERGLAPKAIVGASMRKLAHMIYGVIKSGRPFDARIPLAGLAIQDGI